MIDGIWNSLAPDLKPPVQTLFSPTYCEPTELKQPSNVVTPGGYLVTPDMNSWVPKGPRREVALPTVSRPGTVYSPDDLGFKSWTKNLALENQANTTTTETQPKKAPAQVSINGNLIQYRYKTNDWGETVLAAHSVYENSGLEKSSVHDIEGIDGSTTFEEELPVKRFGKNRAAEPSAVLKNSSSFTKTGKKALSKSNLEFPPSQNKAGTGQDAGPALPSSASSTTSLFDSGGNGFLNLEKNKSSDEVDGSKLLQGDREEIPTAASSSALAEQSKPMKQVSDLEQLFILIKQLVEPVGDIPIEQIPSASRRLRIADPIPQNLPDEASIESKVLESWEDLINLGVIAAANFKKLSPKTLFDKQSPVQYGLNLLNAKSDVQIQCKPTVISTYTPLGATILDLANRSFMPNIISNDLFTAYLAGNERNQRIPIVTVTDVSTFRNIGRDYVVLICGRPGRFIQYFLVSVSFAVGEDKQATNICPVQFLCEEGAEVPASQIEINFGKVKKGKHGIVNYNDAEEKESKSGNGVIMNDSDSTMVQSTKNMRQHQESQQQREGTVAEKVEEGGLYEFWTSVLSGLGTSLT